jgi:Fe2+ or Zn2+ uptake regulation protein
MWVKLDKDIIAHDNEACIFFTTMTGFTADKFMQAMEEKRSRCRNCGKTTFHCDRGFPGEHLVICDKCGQIIDTDFCEAEII